MRLWTLLLPAALWLLIVQRKCERITVGGNSNTFDAGNGIAVMFYSK